MPPTPQEPDRIRFGVYEASLETGELWKNGLKLKLQEQPFRILAMLLARPGGLVSREELQAALWPEAEYGEFEQGLNTAIKKVRQALGDSAENPRFVETLPRKGYRFIAPVHVTEKTVPVEAEPLPAPPIELPPPQTKRRRLWPIPVALAAVAVTAGIYWMMRRPETVRLQFTTPVPLTSMKGFERGPAFSPDGQSIAFTWNGEAEDNFDIYVKSRQSEKLIRLTQDPRQDYGAAWSPDGQRIAFARWLGNGRQGIYLVPAAGGAEVKLAETRAPSFNPHPLMSWSPDGKWLAITDVAADEATIPNASRCIWLLSLETGERRRLTKMPAIDRDDAGPAFSKNGRSLAFIRRADIGRSEIFVLPLTREYQPAGSPRLIETHSDGRAMSLAWMPDSRRLVVAKPWLYGSSVNSGLWLFDTGTPAEPVQIEIAPSTSTTVDVSASGEIAYSWNQSDMNIWRVALDAQHRPVGMGKPFIASTMDDMVPKFSPDGKQLVFISKRGGSDEVWVSRSDGTDPLQLTKMGYTGAPSWSPDGSHIVFDSMKEGQYEVYTMLATGGLARRLTNHAASDGVASYSPDGQLIYFMSNRSGTPQVWRMKADGTDQQPLTRNGGYLPFAAADGKFVYYFKFSKERELWRVPVNGGEEVRLPTSGVSSFLNVALTRQAIYYIANQTPDGEQWLERLDLASQKLQRVMNLNEGSKVWFKNSMDSHVVMSRAGLAVSPDERTLLWAQADQAGSDLMVTKVRTK